MPPKRRRAQVVGKLTMQEKRRRLNPQEERVSMCAGCVKMTTTSGGLQALSSTGFRHHNRQELTAQASKGCPLCFWVYSQIAHIWEPRSQGRLSIFATGSGTSTVSNWGFNKMVVKLQNYSSSTNIPQVSFKISRSPRIFDTEISLSSELEATQTRSTDMGSPEAMQRARSLLELCEKEHPKCSSRQNSTLPTRLLDVGHGDETTCKLHISQPGEQGRYLALSYCWGGPHVFTTTHRTIGKYSQTIQLNKMPQTMQDAVNVARQLGFQYLWIDALCILQDSKMDKHREISHMGEIYKNATLTIAASNALAVCEGFLRNVPAAKAFQIPVHIPEGRFATSTVSLIGLEASKKPFKASLVHEKQPEPLERRGWALQESLLSLRLLSYGSKGMAWRCQTDTINRFPGGVKISKALPSIIFDSSASESGKMESQKQRIATWHSIVEDYSGRELSLPGDRIPAISGIASELARVWQDTYVAGMWTQNLVHDLSWRVEMNPSNNETETALEGPSWAWTSCIGKITFFKLSKARVEVLDCDIQLLNPDLPFGEVTNGMLVIKCCTESLKTLCWRVQRFFPKGGECFFDNGRTHNIRDMTTGFEAYKVVKLGISQTKLIGLILEPSTLKKDNGMSYRRSGICVVDLFGNTEWNLLPFLSAYDFEPNSSLSFGQTTLTLF